MSPPIISSGYNIYRDGTCIDTPAIGDQIGVDPLLGPLQDNGGPTETHALLLGSSATDAIPVEACLDTDQRGVARPQGPDCDIGAFEFEGEGTPLVCKLQTVNPGPPVSIEVFTQDTGSGLAAINVLVASNATVTIPPFTPGTNDPVIAAAEKINPSESSQVQLEVVDVTGNVTVCDPVMTMVIRQKGKPVRDTYTSIPYEEHYVTVHNRDPGLNRPKIIVNGTKFKIKDLGDGEEMTIDVLSAMRPGADNTITLVALGKPVGSADVIIHDSALN